MLSAEAAHVVHERLKPLRLPLITYPKLYGQQDEKDFAYYTKNHPGGWIAILAPQSIGLQGVIHTWTITIDACGAQDRAALYVAKRIQDRLIHLPRNPTAFEFLGDVQVGDGRISKYVLTFVAKLRQGE